MPIEMQDQSGETGAVDAPVSGMGVEYATFRTLKGVGTHHTIQLKRREERAVQDPGMQAPRWVEVQGTGKRICFRDGLYATKDPDEIDQLLNNPICRFGIDIDINRSDPTGYWRKSKLFSFEVKQDVRVTERIGTGPLTLQGKKEAGPAARK